MRILLRTRVGVLLLSSSMYSHYHVSIGIDLDKHTMKNVYEKFGLEPGTQDFIGHAMALYLDDE